MSIAIREKVSDLVLARGEEGSQVVSYEGSLYFDPSAVDEKLLVTTDRTYTCPFKGVCNWVDFVDPSGRRVQDVAWVYPSTKPGHEIIAGKYGFYAGARGATKQEG
jgi:uncharacterized protein (DUF427 family)